LRLLLSVLAILISVGAKAAPPIDAYGKLPAIDLVRLSPSGELIAFIAVAGEDRKLFIRKVGGDALFATEVGAAKILDLEWAGEDYVLISASVTSKYGNAFLDKWGQPGRVELGSVLVVDPNKKTIAQLLQHETTDTVGGLASSLAVRQIDGRWYDFVETYNVRLGYSVYKVDIETGASKILPGFNINDFEYVIDSNGAPVAHSRYNDSTEIWQMLEGDTAMQTIAQRRSPLNLVTMVSLGRTPGTVLVEEDGPQTDKIDEYPAQAGAAPTPLFQGAAPERYLYGRNSRLLIGGVLPRGQGAVLFDDQFQRRYDAAVKPFAGLHVSLESYAADFSRLVLKTDGKDDPGTYWLIDMTTGKADELMSAYPTIDQKEIGPTSIFKYQAGDGQNLEGVLTLPPVSSGKGLPLVVMPHGGPIDVYDWLGFDYWAQAFASRGYAVFQPNYRGSGGYGPAFRQAGYGQWGHKMLTDISDGVTALAAAGVVDKTRVCIAGASYGGYAALAGVTIQHGIYRCAVAVSPVTDVGAMMASWGDSSSTASGRTSQAILGASFSGDPGLIAISPIRHAQDADAPILLVHGKDDTTVPFVHSLSMDATLTRAGKTVEFVQLEGEDHHWSHEKTRLRILEATVEFVQKYNPAP
jgi:dipeptidyl aminopeptidase/acylaminoacyl peptidase